MKASRPRGFTLIEMAFVLAITGILLAAAAPSYANYLARQKLRQLASILELDIRRARMVAGEERVSTSVSFKSGRDWCWGLSKGAPCDCATGLPRCDLGVQDAREYKGVLLQAGQNVAFEGGSARALGWRKIGLSNDRNHQVFIDLNPLGRPQVCGPDAPRYQTCR